MRRNHLQPHFLSHTYNSAHLKPTVYMDLQTVQVMDLYKSNPSQTLLETLKVQEKNRSMKQGLQSPACPPLSMRISVTSHRVSIRVLYPLLYDILYNLLFHQEKQKKKHVLLHAHLLSLQIQAGHFSPNLQDSWDQHSYLSTVIKLTYMYPAKIVHMNIQ